MTRPPRIFALALSFGLALALAACGGGGSGDDDDTPGGDGGGVIDADPTDIDSFDPDSNPNPGCSTDPDSPECDNCVDDDDDGAIDGDDIECASNLDNDEGSFETGIPGDNMDDTWQDCFFDGDSGAGNDGCRYNTCCLYPDGSPDACEPGSNEEESCTILQNSECVEDCGPLTPPGCDCFGCCTVCDELGCETIIINPAVAPDCDEDVIHDPELCPRCELNDVCGTPCDDDPTDCILCPGQDPSELPDTCDNPECPDGQQSCADDPNSCPAGQYCANNCCLPEVD
jgi:hypothetical protein